LNNDYDIERFYRAAKGTGNLSGHQGSGKDSDIQGSVGEIVSAVSHCPASQHRIFIE